MILYLFRYISSHDDFCIYQHSWLYPSSSLPSLFFSFETMLLGHLASELLLLIAGHLESEKDINSLARVNHRLYVTLNGYLYDHNCQHAGASAILWAARYGRDATVRHSLEAGASSEARDRRGRTPLIIAASSKQHAMVEFLLGLPNANPNEQDRVGRTLPWLGLLGTEMMNCCDGFFDTL